MKIVFLDRSTIGPSVNISRPSFEHEWVEYDRSSQSEVADKLLGAQIAITNKVPLRRAQLEQLPDLKMIAVAATGYDCVDMDYCRERGIVVSNVRGYATTTVPEHVIALLFSLRRSIAAYRQDVINGEWQRAQQFCFFNHPIRDLAGSTFGVIGRGALGQAVGRLAEALGMKVVYAEHKGAAIVRPGYTAFDEVLAICDAITLHCPLSDVTRNLISTAEFDKMERKPIIINTGRGGLVNEVAAVNALNNGSICAIGFDVLSAEPISDDHPFQAILERPNVIVTPHVAWASEEAMQILWNQLVGHIENYHKGKASNQID